MKEELTILRSCIATAENQISEMRGALGELRTELTQVTAELKRVQTRAAELERDKARLRVDLLLGQSEFAARCETDQAQILQLRNKINERLLRRVNRRIRRVRRYVRQFFQIPSSHKDFQLIGELRDISAGTSPVEPAIRFQLDSPTIRNGAAVDLISDAFSVNGWAVVRGGVSVIEIAMGGKPLGTAKSGILRPDVHFKFPRLDGAERSGFVFHCPVRDLLDGEHLIVLTVRGNFGDTLKHTFRVTVKKPEDSDVVQSIKRKVSDVERHVLADVLTNLAWSPHFHVIIVDRGGAGDSERRLTILSILGQAWTSWSATILVAGAGSADTAREAVARHAADNSARFLIIDAEDECARELPLAQNGPESLICVCYMGDELGVDALGVFAVASGLHRTADMFYADESRLAPGRDDAVPFFKPDYSPTLLLSTNYIGRPLVVRPSVLAATSVTVGELIQYGVYDVTLRCVETAQNVHHVCSLLSRTDRGSRGNEDDGGTTLARAVARRNISAEVMQGAAPGTWRVRPTGPSKGKISIIIPTCAAKGRIATCINTLRQKTEYRNFEIICAENIPDDEQQWKVFVRDNADKVVHMPRQFNWSRFNNLASEVADGEYLLFLNDDIEIVDPNWLEAMLDDMARPEVGIVGARLLYPDRTVQHAGMFLGADGHARHAFRHADENDSGYFGLALTRREVIAVTGACMMTRRDVFERLGRFEEAHSIINNDLDFCLRAYRAGFLTIYTPFATLIHHERESRESMPEEYNLAHFDGQWRLLFARGDPYFNPRLSRHADNYRIDDEGFQAKFMGYPLMHRGDVKRILIVKLDHLGDFVTALPAIRQLKSIFPAARITVLASPMSSALAQAETAIDEFIPFEFFRARSQLGQRELVSDELVQLTDRLAPYRFDLAVDLRKHLETRHILRCAGAKVLAGYDSIGQFPWLDIALEFGGDKAGEIKHHHITDDLLNLVAAIDAACESKGISIETPPPMQVSEMPEHVRHIFNRPVVAIHPGAGNANRQWPERHFADLIELLLECNDVAVLLIGGEDEVVLASSIMERIGQPDRVGSVAGDIPLRDMPRLFSACVLFIGNNSGPSHIASAAGVATIGIYSGVVDPVEWGPKGKRSVAIYRNMSCSPCYLSIEDCPRAFACMRLLEPALIHQVAQTFLATRVTDSTLAVRPRTSTSHLAKY